MFDGKRLLKHIERAERSGITLIFDEFMFTMLTDGWMAETTRGHLMDDYREVLGHIVEVLGYIPDVEIVHIEKVKGDWEITYPLPEVISESVASFKLYNDHEPVMDTGLYYGGELWQTGDGTIRRCGVTGPHPGVKPVLTDSDILAFIDVSSSEAAWFTTFRPREDISTERACRLWEHLEGVMWNDWPTGDGQIKGQEEIESQ